MSPTIELRTTLRQPVQVRSIGARTIGGYGAVFGKLSQNLGGFFERVHPQAFNKSRSDGWPGVVARYNHADQMLLGTTAAGTLRLNVDGNGLAYDVDLPETRGDVYELVQRGDVAQSSFAFQTYDDDWSHSDGLPTRTLLSCRLIDVAPVVSPAYTDATVGLRSLASHVGAPLEDVVDLANREELRQLFTRTDIALRPASPPEVATRQHHPAAEPPPISGDDAAAELDRTRHPGGSPRPGPMSGRTAQHLIAKKRQKSGNEALLEIQSKRWPVIEIDRLVFTPASESRSL